MTKVVTIWDGFQKYFEQLGLPFDYVLYTSYERQVQSLFDGHIHLAWNSPLAWLQSVRVAGSAGRRAKAICMRDTDIGRPSSSFVPAALSRQSPI